MARTAGGRAFPGQPHHRRPLGLPLPAARRHRNERPHQPTAPPAPQNPGHRRGTGSPTATRAPDRAATTGRPMRHRLLDSPPDPGPARPATIGRPGPGHRRARPPLRTRPSRRTGPHRRQEAGPDPPRRRPQNSRPGRGPPQPDRRRQLGLPAHRPRRPHRIAYTEDLPDETASTCAAFLVRATAHFASLGIRIERVLTDNAWAYSKNTWRNTCRDLDISPRWTRPWRPQTNGKVERFHRTLLDEWGYHKPYTSDHERRQAFTHWLQLVQLPPTPHRNRRPHTRQPQHQPSRTTQLGGFVWISWSLVRVCR